ncbi:Dol-P-Man:Man(5)GlcNAc(2)-PP-Dol alpha-1 [Chlorella vulgaris]
MARTRLQTSRGRSRAGGGGLDQLVTALAAAFARLNNPADRQAQLMVAAALLVVEAALCFLIIQQVPYTEIDWEAYMQEVTGFLQGERDYEQLKGGTGPLVYPAGFVYLFAGLKQLTAGSVVAAQYVFAGLYLVTQATVMALYIRTASLPPWSLALLCASRRLHSIFLLRLFNDCWAMAVAYIATLALQSRRWVTAVVLYSLAVSVKMNVLLMAPGVLAVLLKFAWPPAVLAGIALGVLLQLGLGAPFLLPHPRSYVSRAFEFSRVFTYKWSVNWQLLPEPYFLSRQLAIGLLLLHLRLLWSLAQQQWLKAEGGVWPALRRFFGCSPLAAVAARNRPASAAAAAAAEVSGARAAEVKQQHGGRVGSSGGAVSAGSSRDIQTEDCHGSHGSSSFEDGVLFVVFSSNLAGLVASRTIHYQFYCWYFHTLPFLLLRSPLPRWLALATLAAIELVYNVYPPTPWASLLLLALHLLAMGATLKARVWGGGAAASSGKGGRVKHT